MTSVHHLWFCHLPLQFLISPNLPLDKEICCQTSVLTMSNFMRIVCLQDFIDHVPETVQNLVKICSSVISLVVDRVERRPLIWFAEGVCGPSQNDQVSMFHQLDSSCQVSARKELQSSPRISLPGVNSSAAVLTCG